MELKKVFPYLGWRIRYVLLEPSHSPQHISVKSVVFVHGTPWSSVTFLPLAKALQANGRYRILLYDLPGYGQSQRYSRQPGEEEEGKLFSGDTSVRFQAEALSALLKHLKLDGREGNEAPAVVAHDIAGAITLRAHLLHGCAFRSLLLMDTNAVLPWGDGFYKLVRAEPEVFLKLPFGIFEAMLRGVIRSAVFHAEKIKGEWEDALARPWVEGCQREGEEGTEGVVQPSFVRQIAQADDADVKEMLERDAYQQVRCPVKILWGEEDRWIPKEKMGRLAGMVKHCLKGFVVIPEAGHLIMVDQPERVAIEVFDWLAEY